LQHLVEQVYGDAVGKFGHGQAGEFPGRAVNIERGPDLAGGSLEQVEPGKSLPMMQRDCLQVAGDVHERGQHPQHLAVLRHPVRRPREDPALARQGLLQVHVDHGNAPLHHLLGEGALDRGPVHAVVDL
jgi:hypothetical protein